MRAAVCALSAFPTLISLEVDSVSSISHCIILWPVWSPSPLGDLSSTGVLCGFVSLSKEPSRIQAYPASGGHGGGGKHQLPVSAVGFREREGSFVGAGSERLSQMDPRLDLRGCPAAGGACPPFRLLDALRILLASGPASLLLLVFCRESSNGEEDMEQKSVEGKLDPSPEQAPRCHGH